MWANAYKSSCPVSVATVTSQVFKQKSALKRKYSVQREKEKEREEDLLDRILCGVLSRANKQTVQTSQNGNTGQKPLFSPQIITATYFLPMTLFVAMPKFTWFPSPSS